MHHSALDASLQLELSLPPGHIFCVCAQSSPWDSPVSPAHLQLSRVPAPLKDFADQLSLSTLGTQSPTQGGSRKECCLEPVAGWRW